MTLDDLKKGDIAVVEESCCIFMMERGFVPNEIAEIITVSRMGIKVKVKGTVWGISHDCAKLVKVKENHDDIETFD